MPDLCLYCQVHQPFRLRRYRVFDIGTGAGYFDDEANATILRRVAEKCYLPINRLLLRDDRALRRPVPPRAEPERHAAGPAREWTPRGAGELPGAGRHRRRRAPGRDVLPQPRRRSPIRRSSAPRWSCTARAIQRHFGRRPDGVPQHRADLRRRDRAVGGGAWASRGSWSRAPTRCSAGARPTTSTGRRRRRISGSSAQLPAERRHRVPLLQPRLGPVAADGGQVGRLDRPRAPSRACTSSWTTRPSASTSGRRPGSSSSWRTCPRRSSAAASRCVHPVQRRAARAGRPLELPDADLLGRRRARHQRLAGQPDAARGARAALPRSAGGVSGAAATRGCSRPGAGSPPATTSTTCAPSGSPTATCTSTSARTSRPTTPSSRS